MSWVGMVTGLPSEGLGCCGGQHQDPGPRTAHRGQRQVDRHLVAVEYALTRCRQAGGLDRLPRQAAAQGREGRVRGSVGGRVQQDGARCMTILDVVPDDGLARSTIAAGLDFCAWFRSTRRFTRTAEQARVPLWAGRPLGRLTCGPDDETERQRVVTRLRAGFGGNGLLALEHVGSDFRGGYGP